MAGQEGDREPVSASNKLSNISLVFLPGLGLDGEALRQLYLIG
jgi:hypothetical protein